MNKLQKKLEFIDGMCIIISIMIGSGIFASPGLILNYVNNPYQVILLWVISGFIVIITSLCYSMLGARYPSSGGDYIYLKHAYGSYISFSFIWYYFWISKPGSQAILSIVFSDYFLYLIYERHIFHFYLSKLVSILLILLLTTINCLGIKESSTFMNILTGLKLGLILFITINGFIFMASNPSIIQSNFSLSNSSSSSFSSSSMFDLKIISAIIPCLWAYEGWADINFLLEEFKATTTLRYLSTLVCSSIVIVMICYVLINIAYFTVLPIDSILNTTTIGLDFGYRIHRIVGIIIAVGITICTVGSTHGSILTGEFLDLLVFIIYSLFH